MLHCQYVKLADKKKEVIMNKSDKPPHLSIEFAETIISIDEYLFTGCRTGIKRDISKIDFCKVYRIPSSLSNS